MSFWKNSGRPFDYLLTVPHENLLLIVSSMTRMDLIEWLVWNDPNGIYHDSVSLKELGRKMTKEEGVEILLRQVAENTV